MHRSARDEVFTDDVLESTIGDPMTIVEVDFEIGTQGYGVSSVSKAYVLYSDRGENSKDMPP
jgi:hypothetical protein